jgi:hypothetical protein
VQRKDKRENGKRKKIPRSFAHKPEWYSNEESQDKKHRVNQQPDGANTYKSFCRLRQFHELPPQ